MTSSLFSRSSASSAADGIRHHHRLAQGCGDARGPCRRGYGPAGPWPAPRRPRCRSSRRRPRSGCAARPLSAPGRSRACGSVRSIQASSVRGVMMARTGLSARRSTRSIMSRSLGLQNTPAWVPSASRALSSSSVTSWRGGVRAMPSRRRTRSEDFPSSQTIGRRDARQAGDGEGPAQAAISLRRAQVQGALGTSSPSTSVR